MSADVHTDAEARYVEAAGRRDAIRDAWEEAGAPLLSTGSKAQLVEHPLLRMLRDHDLLVDRLSGALRQRHRGPEPTAVPTITRSPGAKLRAAK